MKNTRLLVFNIINIVFLVYSICLSTGYALFSDKINFYGVARTVEYYAGSNLPVTPLVVDTANNRYYTYSTKKSCETLTSNAWSDSTIDVVHTRNWCFLSGSETVTYTASFRNDTVLTMSDGVATATITENGNNKMSNVSASMSKTTVLPGETVELYLVLTINLTLSGGTQTARGSYAFNFQNSTKYVYFTMSFK